MGTNLCYAGAWVSVDTGSVAVNYLANPIDPQTEIQFTVTPDASDPTEKATVKVAIPDCNTDWGPCFVPVSITVQILKHSAKCATAIMQPQYISLFEQMGQDPSINPLFIMSTALQESGWDLAHVYGTNSSSKGQPLNNLFGMTNAGGNNIAYPSVSASARAWEQDWGPYLAYNPQTIQQYAADINSNPTHMYNSNPAYPGQLAARYNELVTATAACNVHF